MWIDFVPEAKENKVWKWSGGMKCLTLSGAASTQCFWHVHVKISSKTFMNQFVSQNTSMTM